MPEGTILSSKQLLHLGKRTAIDQALSRLVKCGEVLRVQRGLFTLPIWTQFGVRPPAVCTVVENIAKLTGERVAINGANAANKLGLMTQVPTRYIFWTSGPSRHLTLGRQVVELKHVPSWQLSAPDSFAGEAFRALVFFGPREVREALHKIKLLLPKEELQKLFGLRANTPTWLATELSILAVSAADS
ncbi:MAG: DUF6088 family protein [Aestuariivita sp.]|nr:DUF6088 family protein [Aestuariivita sp.]MCY4202612.1 DUF6088 family protein [Aestuariivita sp.]